MPKLNATDLEYGHSHKESLIFHITSLEDRWVAWLGDQRERRSCSAADESV